MEKSRKVLVIAGFYMTMLPYYGFCGDWKRVMEGMNRQSRGFWRRNGKALRVLEKKEFRDTTEIMEVLRDIGGDVKLTFQREVFIEFRERIEPRMWEIARVSLKGKEFMDLDNLKFDCSKKEEYEITIFTEIIKENVRKSRVLEFHQRIKKLFPLCLSKNDREFENLLLSKEQSEKFGDKFEELRLKDSIPSLPFIEALYSSGLQQIRINLSDLTYEQWRCLDWYVKHLNGMKSTTQGIPRLNITYKTVVFFPANGGFSEPNEAEIELCKVLARIVKLYPVITLDGLYN